MIEIGLIAWDKLADPSSSEDDLTYGNLLVRAGLDSKTELQIGFNGYGTAHSRDRISGTNSHQQGPGDLSVGLRRSLSGPGGAIAVQANITLPIGGGGIGAGDWSAQLRLPIRYKLQRGFELDLTPEVDAAVNASGSGRHPAYGAVVGLAHGLGPNLSLAAEIGAWHNDEPHGHATDLRGALSLAWQAGRNWQIDIEGDAGLTAAAPRHSLMVGLARRF